MSAKFQQAAELFDRLCERTRHLSVSRHEVKVFVMLFLAAMEEMERLRPTPPGGSDE